MDQRRADISSHLMEAIEQSVAELFYTPCKNMHRHVGRHIDKLKCNELWPLAKLFRGTSIRTVLVRMTSVQDTLVNECCNICTFGTTTQSRGMAEKLREAKHNILSAKMGVCLDCVKTGRESRQAGECRTKHDNWSCDTSERAGQYAL